jgi:hypothetical protein
MTMAAVCTEPAVSFKRFDNYLAQRQRRAREMWREPEYAPAFSGVDSDEAAEVASLLMGMVGNGYPRYELCVHAFALRERGKMGPRTFGKFLQFAWVAGKSGSLFRVNGIPYCRVAYAFSLTEPRYLMEPEDYKRYLALPDIVELYRGGAGLSIRRLSNGMSWTSNLGCAAWFATVFHGLRKRTPVCVSATFRKSDVLMLCDGKEAEFVVRSGRARSVREVAVDQAMGDAWKGQRG